VAAATVGIQVGAGLLQADFVEGALEPLLGLVGEFDRQFALGQPADEGLEVPRQLVVAGMCDQLVQVIGDGPDVFGDAPLVVVEDADEFLGGVADVVQRLKGDAVGQRGVAENADDVFAPAFLVARGGDAQGGGEGGAGMARAITIMFALRAQGEPVQAVRLPDGAKPVRSLCT
jgi:hypothetical protein